jgi:hypothetical protein
MTAGDKAFDAAWDEALREDLERSGDWPLLLAAIDRAEPIVEAMRVAGVDVIAVAPKGLTGEVLLAHAFMRVVDRLSDRAYPTETSLIRCCWCLAAGGGSREAWDELEPRPMAAGMDHALKCEHNPLARAVRDYLAAMESPEDSEAADDRAFETLAHLKTTAGVSS